MCILKIHSISQILSIAFLQSTLTLARRIFIVFRGRPILKMRKSQGSDLQTMYCSQMLPGRIINWSACINAEEATQAVLTLGRISDPDSALELLAQQN